MVGLQIALPALLAPRPPPPPTSAEGATTEGGSIADAAAAAGAMDTEIVASGGEVVMESNLDVGMDEHGNPSLNQSKAGLDCLPTAVVTDYQYYESKLRPLILTLEILTNLCSADRGKDDEDWEDEEGPSVLSPGAQAVMQVVAGSGCFAQVLKMLEQLCAQLPVVAAAGGATAIGEAAGAGGSSGGGGSSSSGVTSIHTGVTGVVCTCIHRACCCLSNMLQNFPITSLGPLLTSFTFVSEQAMRIATAVPTLAFHKARY